MPEETSSISSENMEAAQPAPQNVPQGHSGFFLANKFWTWVLIAVALFFGVGVLVTSKDITAKYVHNGDSEVPTKVMVKESTQTEMTKEATTTMEATPEEDMKKDEDTVAEEVMKEIDAIRVSDDFNDTLSDLQ